MSLLTERRCKACSPGTAVLDPAQAAELAKQLDAGWSIVEDGKALKRAFRFEDFYCTMAFANAVAWIANAEDHHPDLELGYNYCRIRFSTHAIGGLSVNDFICAAKIDAL